MSTKCWNVGEVRSSTCWDICYVNFCRLVSKVTETSDIISGVNGPIFTEIAHNVANWNCDIWMLFGTCACWIKVISPILPNIGCHGNVPWGIRKRSGSIKFTQISCIRWKNRENRSSRSWDNLAKWITKKKEINASQIYSLFGRDAQQVKTMRRWNRLVTELACT